MDKNIDIAGALHSIRKSLDPSNQTSFKFEPIETNNFTTDLNVLESNIKTVIDYHEDVLGHMRRQVNCYRESLAALRKRCDILVTQNQALHAELEQHIQLDIGDMGNVGDMREQGVCGSEAGSNHVSIVDQLLELRGVHEQQITVLQRQVHVLKAELKDATGEVDRLKSEGVRNTLNVSADVTNSAVTRLEKDKEDLETALANLQNIVQLMKNREDDAMNKVKKSMEMVDKVKADQETLELKLKKSYDELNRVRERHSVQIAQAKAELQQIHEETVADLKDEIKKLENSARELEKENTTLLSQAEGLKSERDSLLNTVERYREQGLSSMEVVDKTSQQLRDQLRNALKERDDAIGALALHKNSVQLELHDRGYEVQQLQNELAHTKERLISSENNCRTVTMETSHLHDEIANLKIGISKIQNEKVSLEKTTGLTIEHLKMVSSQAEAHAKSEIEEINSRHRETVNQLHSLLQKQQNLANKWRKAHQESSDDFTKTTQHLASDMSQLKKENQQLKNTNKEISERLKTLTEKNKSLKHNEKKMSKSLKLAESHIIKTAEELYNTVQKKKDLMKENIVMSKEISLLQSQLCQTPQVIPITYDHPVKDTDLMS